MTDAEREERKSRSQIKREFLELKDLGKQLVGLSRGQLQGIPLSQVMHVACQRPALSTAGNLPCRHHPDHEAYLVEMEPTDDEVLDGEKDSEYG